MYLGPKDKTSPDGYLYELKTKDWMKNTTQLNDKDFLITPPSTADDQFVIPLTPSKTAID